MGNLLIYYCKGNLTFMFILIISYLLYAPLTVADDSSALPMPWKKNCTGASFTVNSTFSTNLEALFSSLISQSTSSISNQSTAGSAADMVYGLYLCQGDLPPSSCNRYLLNAKSNITGDCTKRQGIIWYDYIMLRYSDTDFFGIEDSSGFSMTRPDKQTTSTEPYKMVSELIQQAPDKPSYFASKASKEDSRYAMAQCTVDLSKDNCSRCLKTILGEIQTCCTGADGWRYLAPSCWIRYETTPFLFGLTTPSPSAPSPQPEEQNRGSNKKTKAPIAAIVAPILVLWFYLQQERNGPHEESTQMKHFGRLPEAVLLFSTN